MKALLFILFLFALTISFSQDVTAKLKVFKLEARSKDNNKWSDWTNMNFDKESYFVINNSIKLITWEEKDLKGKTSYTTYKITGTKIDSSLEEYFGIYLVDYLLDKEGSVKFKLCYLSNGNDPYYTLVTQVYKGSNIQFRYSLREL